MLNRLRTPLFLIAFGAVMLTGVAWRVLDPESALSKLRSAFFVMREQYVEPIDEPAVVEGAIRGMLADLDPHSAYLTPAQMQRVRDEYEMALVRAFVAAGKPVFGICRGLQLINVAHGGTLYQDISTQKPGALVHRDAHAYDLHFHDVQVLPGTRLAALLGGGRHKINSVHHQGIKDLAPGFTVEAVSPDDGVIEAIRRTGQSWVAAVQWHPEFHRPELGVVDDTPLLRDFLQAALAARGA